MTQPPGSREGPAAPPPAAAPRRRRRSSSNDDDAARQQREREDAAAASSPPASGAQRQLASLLSFRYRQHLPFSGRGLATARLSAADYEAHAAQGTLAIQDQLHFAYPVAQRRTILQRLGLKHGRTARSAGSSPVRERPACGQQSPGKEASSMPGSGSAGEQQQQQQQQAAQEGLAREPRQRSQSARRPSGQCSLSPGVGISSRAASPAGSVLAAGGQTRQAAGQLAALDVSRSACSSPRGRSGNPSSPAKAQAPFHIAFGRRWPVEPAASGGIEPAASGSSSGSSGSRRSTRSPSRTRDAYSGPASLRSPSPAAGAPRDGSRVHSGVGGSSRSSTQGGPGQAVRGSSADDSTRASTTDSTFCAATPVGASRIDAGTSRPSATLESPLPAADPAVAAEEGHAGAAAAGSSPGSSASRGGAMRLLQRVLSPSKRALDEPSSAPASLAGSPAASLPAQQADGSSIRRWLLRASGAGSQRASLDNAVGAAAPAATAAAAEPPASAADSVAAEAGAVCWPDAAVLQSHPLSLSPGWEQSSGSADSPLLLEHPLFIQKVAAHNPEGADLLSPRASSRMSGSPWLAPAHQAQSSPRTLSWGRASLRAQHLAPSGALLQPLAPTAGPAVEEQPAGSSSKDAVQGHALLQQLLAATPTDSEAESCATSPAAARTHASLTTVDAPVPAAAAWSEYDLGCMPTLRVRTGASTRSSQQAAEPGLHTTCAPCSLGGLSAEPAPAAAMAASAGGALSSPGMSEPGSGGRAGSTANASDLSPCNSDGEEYGDERHARTGVRRYSSAAGASRRRSRGRTHSTVVNWDSLERHTRGSDEASDAHRSRSPSSLGGAGLKPLVSPAQYSATAAAAAAGASILAAVAPAMAGSLPQLEAAAVAAVAAVAARACSMDGSPGASLLRASLPGFEGQPVQHASLELEDTLDPVSRHADGPTSAQQRCEAAGALHAACLMHGLAADGSGGGNDEGELEPILCVQDEIGPHERLQADAHLPGGAELRGRRHGRAAGAAAHQAVRATLDLPDGAGLGSMSASCELHQLEETWQQQLQRVAAECQAVAGDSRQQTEEFHSCGGESAAGAAGGGDTRRSSQALDGSEGGRKLTGAAADANDARALPRTASGSDISAEVRRATAEVMAEIERTRALRAQAAVAAAAAGVQLTRLSASGSEFYSAQEQNVHSSSVSPSTSCGGNPLAPAAAEQQQLSGVASQPGHSSTSLSELSDDMYDFCQEMRVQARERQRLLRMQQQLEHSMVQLQEAMAAAMVPAAAGAEPTEASQPGEAAAVAHTQAVTDAEAAVAVEAEPAAEAGAITCEPEAAAPDAQAGGVPEAGAAADGTMPAAEEAAGEALLVGSAGEEDAAAAAQAEATEPQAEAAADNAELTPAAQASEAAASITDVPAPAIKVATEPAGAAAGEAPEPQAATASEAPELGAAAAAAGAVLAAATASASALPQEEAVYEEAVQPSAGVDAMAPEEEEEQEAETAPGTANAVLAVSPPEAALDAPVTAASAAAAGAADVVEPAEAAATAEAQPDGALAASPPTMAAEQAVAAADARGTTPQGSSTRVVRSYASAVAAGAPPRAAPASSKDEQQADEQHLQPQDALSSSSAGESSASATPSPELAAGWGAAAAVAVPAAAAASAGSGQQPSVAAMAMALPALSLTVEVPAAPPGFAGTPSSSWGGCSVASTPASRLARSYAAAAGSSGGGATPRRATTPGGTTPRRVADPGFTNTQERQQQQQQPGWKAKLQRLTPPHASGGGAGGGLVSHASLGSDEPGSPWRIPAAAGEPQAASCTGSAPSSLGGAGSSGGGSSGSGSSGGQQQQQLATQGGAGIKSSSSRRCSQGGPPSPAAQTPSAPAASLVSRRLTSNGSILAHSAPAAGHLVAPAVAAAGDDSSATVAAADSHSQEAGICVAPAEAAPQAAGSAAAARAEAAKAVPRAPAKGSSNAPRPSKQTSKASRKAAAAAAAAANRAPPAGAVAVARPGFWEQLLAVAAAWWQQVTALALALLLAGAVYHARPLTLLAKHAPTHDQVRAALQGLPDALRATAAKQVLPQGEVYEVPAWHLQQLEAQVDEAMVAQRGSSWQEAAGVGDAAAAGEAAAASVASHNPQLSLDEPQAALQVEELLAAAAGHAGPGGKEPVLPLLGITSLQRVVGAQGAVEQRAVDEDAASLLQDDDEGSASDQLQAPGAADEVPAADGQAPAAADQPDAVTAEQQQEQRQPDGGATAADVESTADVVPAELPAHAAEFGFDYDEAEADARGQQQQGQQPPQQQVQQQQLASLLDKFMGLLQSRPVDLEGADDEDVALMLHMEQRESQQLAQLQEQARDADSQQEVAQEAEAGALAAAAAGSNGQQQQPEGQEPETASAAASEQQPDASGATPTTPSVEAEEDDGLHADSWLPMELQQEEATAAAAADDGGDGLGALAELLAQQQQQEQQEVQPGSWEAAWEQEVPLPEQTTSLLKGPLSSLLAYWRKPAAHHHMGHPQHGDTQRLGLFGQLLSQVHLNAEADAELLAFLQQQQQPEGEGGSHGQLPQSKPPSDAGEASLEFEEEAAAGAAATDEQQVAGSNESQAAAVSTDRRAEQEEQQAPQEEATALGLQADGADTWLPLEQAEQLDGVAAADGGKGAHSAASLEQQQPSAAGSTGSMTGAATLLAATAGVVAAAAAGLLLLLPAWRSAAAAAGAQDQHERPDIDSDGYEGDEEWGYDAGGDLDVDGGSDDDEAYDAAADSDDDASADDVSLVASDASDSMPAAPGSTARSRGTAAAAAAATAAVQTAAATGRRLLQAAGVAGMRRGHAAAGHEVAAASSDFTWLRPNNMVPRRQLQQQQVPGSAGPSPSSVDRRWLRNRVITQISGQAAHNREVMALVQGQPAVRQTAAAAQQQAAGGQQQQGGPSPGRGAGGSSGGGGGAARRSPHSPASGSHHQQQQQQQRRGRGSGGGSRRDDRVAVVLDF